MIRNYLKKDADIKEKSPDEQKRVIQTYISSVIVFETEVEINNIVTFNGGGEAYAYKVTINIDAYRHKH